jgi:hypothetical protein
MGIQNTDHNSKIIYSLRPIPSVEAAVLCRNAASYFDLRPGREGKIAAAEAAGAVNIVD